MGGQYLELKNVLKDAVYREIGAGNFYKSIAERIKNAEGKEKFHQLSRDEEGHRVKLESWFRRLFGEDVAEVPEGPVDSETRDFEIGDRTGAVEALGVAIEAEARANDFYKAQAEKADDPGLKELFLELAAEEEGHYNLLEAERSFLIGGFYWFDMDSLSFMED